ncbi:MAG: HAMP domain-containing histidine kinase, partial [Planctomycetes bacterium]|nr:HAMP domain-containing histidine kinase [Planctomycetota bacterium]
GDLGSGPAAESTIALSRPRWAMLGEDLIALVFPEEQRGVWLDRASLASWAREYAGVPVEIVPWAPAEPEGSHRQAAVIAGFAAARLPLEERDSRNSGPIIMAILVVALAGLCGGGAWFALRAAHREAQTARFKGEFLTTVTHELKTPLAGIRLVSELLVDDHVRDANKRKHYLQALSAESTRLSMLIENVLDLRRMERGERAHDARVEDMGKLVKSTVDLFAPLLERGGIRVELEGLDDPLQVIVDPDDLRQAFLNLLDNARKYGGAGKIHIGLAKRGARAVLSLTDGGPGIDPDERERIFERFARGKNHQHGGIPGVGIGLNLARAILRRQGGDLVACEPPAGHSGACFELSLPLHNPKTGA